MKKWLSQIGIVLLIVGVFYYQQRKIAGLEEGLERARLSSEVLPSDVVTTATLDQHILKQLSRIDGTDSVYITEQYVPVESEVQYIVRTDTVAMGRLEQAQALLLQLESQMATVADSARVDSLRVAIDNLQRMLYIVDVEFDEYGFCCEPNIGMGLDFQRDLNISLGARLAYYKRFGAGLEGSVGFPTDSLFRTEHPTTFSLNGYLDGRIPGYENVAGKIFGGYDFTHKDWQVGGGLNFYWK